MSDYTVYCVIYFICVLSICASHDEPRCSKFDFEEKVLEKQVRIEFQINRLKLEFAEAIAEMKETKNKIEQYVNTVDERIENMKGTFDIAALEHRVNETLAKQTNDLKSIKGRSTTPLVLFKARTLPKTTYNNRESLIFSHVYLEHGEGYNPRNGSFVVPTSGTYLLGVTLCLSGTGCVIGIVVDDKNILVHVAYTSGGSPCFSYSTVEVLSKGQQVVVKALPGYFSCNFSQQEEYRWNTFYGFLIRE